MWQRISICLLVLTTSQTCSAGLQYFVADQAGFNSVVLSNTTGVGQSLLVDDGAGIFGAAPVAGSGLANVSRSGTSGALSFSYLISDVNFAPGQPYGSTGTLSVGNDIQSTSTLAVESVASQGGASTGSWGIDTASAPDRSSIGGLASPNATIFDFTGSATSVDHFGVTLLDFEAGFDNGDGVAQSGFIRVYDSSDVLVDSFAINLTGPNFGDGEAIHVGIYADAGTTLDKVVFVLGDDNDSNTSNGWGGGEQFAATEFTLGFTSPITGVPEPSGLMFAGLLGCLSLFSRIRKPRSFTG